jgi:hypothetical protein
METYTLFWLDGKREVVQGATITTAITAAGYGGGATRALDFWANGDETGYQWDGKQWNKLAS